VGTNAKVRGLPFKLKFLLKINCIFEFHIKHPNILLLKDIENIFKQTKYTIKTTKDEYMKRRDEIYANFVYGDISKTDILRVKQYFDKFELSDKKSSETIVRERKYFMSIEDRILILESLLTCNLKLINFDDLLLKTYELIFFKTLLYSRLSHNNSTDNLTTVLDIIEHEYKKLADLIEYDSSYFPIKPLLVTY
jgi:hypothetical protein